ncbi:MAG: hypothetical protein KJ958_15960 [Gammaproteobacteria bacterium]|nr:hypothetical protein [Gammaproteobacteria bacterium]
MIQFLRKVVSRLLYPINPYWTASIYGFGKWIRRYGFYPPMLPLCIYTDHGPGDAGPFDHEIGSTAPVQFYHSPDGVERWRANYTKPCYVLYSPFVFARKQLQISRLDDAKGTLFFVAHSTESVHDRKSVEMYHHELSLLPEKFLPVTICMHMHDIKKGLDADYRKLGYAVVSAGESLDQGFTERFYRILVQHRYVLSNIFGAYALYAVEIGLPFGLYGSPPNYLNVSDKNIEQGEYKSYQSTEYYKTAVKLFAGLPEEQISKEAHDFVARYLGIADGISRYEMAKVLYGSFFRWGCDRMLSVLSLRK